MLWVLRLLLRILGLLWVLLLLGRVLLRVRLRLSVRGRGWVILLLWAGLLSVRGLLGRSLLRVSLVRRRRRSLLRQEVKLGAGQQEERESESESAAPGGPMRIGNGVLAGRLKRRAGGAR